MCIIGAVPFWDDSDSANSEINHYKLQPILPCWEETEKIGASLEGLVLSSRTLLVVEMSCPGQLQFSR